MTKAKDTAKEAVKLVGLKVVNFNRVEVAEMRFEGDGLVLVSGKNGHGKTSALDALAWAFGGPRAVPNTGSPIRHGAAASDVLVTTSDFTLERRQTPYGQKFVLKGRDGRERKTGQAALDAMLSTLTFDPLAFARMKPVEQRAALIAALGLEGDLARIETDRKAAFEERTVASRQLKAVTAQLADLGPAPEMFDSDEEESAAELLARIREAGDISAEWGRLGRLVSKHEEERAAAYARIARLRDEIAELEGRIAEIDIEIMEAHEERDGLVVPDVTQLERKLAGIEAANAAARRVKAWRAKNAEVETARKTVEELTAAIEAADVARETLVAGAQLPVAGLKVEDEGLSLNGVPLGQSSSAEQIRLGTSVAMALDPTLRVLRIAEGSLLDGETRVEIDRLARQHGFLVLAELVADQPTGEPGEIWITDGHTVSA